MVSGFSILAHAWNTSCFGLYRYLSVWREVGALCVERLAIFVPSLPTLCFPLCISVTGAHSSRGRWGSWLGCQVLPAIGAVSILELAANSGSSRMFRAPNLQRATMLFTVLCYHLRRSLQTLTSFPQRFQDVELII